MRFLDAYSAAELKDCFVTQSESFFAFWLAGSGVGHQPRILKMAEFGEIQPAMPLHEQPLHSSSTLLNLNHRIHYQQS